MTYIKDITKGRTFNSADELVCLESDGKLPTIDGSNLTGLSAGGGIPYTGATSDVDLGSNELTAKQVNAYNDISHGQMYVGNNNLTPNDNMGGYLYIGKFGAPQGSGNSVGAIYFESKTTDSMTHVAGVQANIVQGNTTRRLTTGNLDFTTKDSTADDPRSRLRIDQNGNIGFGGTITDFNFTGADMVLENGKLGIGTTTPTKKFTIYSSGDNDDVYMRLGLDQSVSDKRWDIGILGSGTGAADARLAFEYQGSEKVCFLQGGNVGIGTSLPAEFLHLKATAPTLFIEADNANIASLRLAENNPASGQGGFLKNIGASNRFDIGVNYGGVDTSIISILYASGSTNGNVGIGTTTPDHELDVSGTASTAIRVDSATGSDTNVVFSVNGNENFYVGYDTSEDVFAIKDSDAGFAKRFTIDRSGDAVFSGNVDVGGNIVVTGTVDGIDIGVDVAANTAKTSYTKTNVMGHCVHGATAGTARPTGFDVVTWIGSVSPDNATDDDIWVDVS